MGCSSDDLRAGAERLFFAANPQVFRGEHRARYEERGSREQVVGEAPVRDGATLVVAIRWPAPGVGRSSPLVSLREFLKAPWGERYPTRYGMTMDSQVLPLVATSLATVMEVLATAAEAQKRAFGDRR